MLLGTHSTLDSAPCLAGPGARPREGGWEGVRGTLSLSLLPLCCSSLSLGISSSVRVVEILSLQLTLSIQSPTQNVGSLS